MIAESMQKLGPFEPSPRLAAAVSGGADSMALAILAQQWVRQRGGSILALVVDHALRPTSAAEANLTVDRLEALGIPARLLRLAGLRHGPALAERARTMRYQVLTDACRQAGILHLLLGHHAADQVETVMMRVLHGSRTHGLAGMPALRERAGVRMLRPLLGIEPAALRDLLSRADIAWVEDPSNHDMTALRPRLRHRLAPAPELTAAIAAVCRLREREESATARELARRATIRPEGFAILSPGPVGAAALGRLIRTIGGLCYPPSPGQLTALAATPGPATIAGVRVIHAGRMGDGWLIAREEAAVMAPVALSADTLWDNRFRVINGNGAHATVGKLGDDAARFRKSSNLPSAVLRTLPAIRHGQALAAVPHLGYATNEYDIRVNVMFSPAEPVAGACFSPANGDLGHQL